MKFIVDAKWLKENLLEANIRVVDCRFSLNDRFAGQKAYHSQHIPSAVYFDLEKDLSGIPSEHGGRHPLPPIKEIKEKLENAGIDHKAKVIVYDDGGGEYASRFWWILTYLGHQNVFILDGGFQAWKMAGYPIDNQLPSFEKTTFDAIPQSNMLATIEDVKANSKNKFAILIDSRAPNRYIGLEEPIDKIAGHIPGAINKFWNESLKNGFWKSVEEQKERFSEFHPSDSFIVYCGSGVTATPNIIALLEAGFSNVRLYAGSYSDWVSYDENPIETGDLNTKEKK